MRTPEEILNIIQYFWEEKGDIERWHEYNRDDVQKIYPEIIKAWDEYQIAKRLLDAVVRGAKP